MIASWLSTVRVIRILSSAAAVIRISSPTAMPKIFNPIGKRMAPPPSGTKPVAGMGRPARYVADYSGTALRRCSRRAISSDISGYRSCWLRSSVPEVSRSNEIRSQPASLTAKTARCSARLGRNSLLCVYQGAPLPSPPVASDPFSRSCWCGRRPQPGDQRVDVLEHPSRHRDLGRLKGRVAAVTHDPGADLDKLLAQAGQRPRLRRLRHRQRPHEIAEIVGQRVELEADGVGGEGSA